MALKLVVSDISTVAEPLRPLYELKDGKYVLPVEGDVPGYVPAIKHAEFRDTNTRLLKALGAETIDAALQRAGLFNGIDSDRLAALKDIDPAKYRELVSKAEEFEKKGMKKPDDVETAIAAALEKFKTSVVGPLQEKLTATEKANQAKDQRLADAALRSSVGERFIKAGGKANAIDFIVDNARKAFRVVDDRIVAGDGQYGQDGNPLTVDEWIVGATKAYDFAFEPSKGGGAAPAGAGGGAPRPGSRQMINPTPQELGALKFVAGKGMVDASGQAVEIVQQ